MNSIVTLRFITFKSIKQVSQFSIRNCIFGGFVEKRFCLGSRFMENGTQCWLRMSAMSFRLVLVKPELSISPLISSDMDCFRQRTDVSSS